MSRGAFIVSVLAVFCSVILFPAISISSVPAIVGQDDGGTGNSPVSLSTGEKSKGHQVSVNVTTGNAVVKHTDLVIPTRGRDIVIQRTYNSLEHLNGVEEGLDINGTLIKKGTARINGERAILENDYTFDPSTFGIPVEAGYMFYIYIYNNPDDVGIDVTRHTLPQNAPSNYYLIGKVHIYRPNGPGYDMGDPIFEGVSLRDGKVIEFDIVDTRDCDNEGMCTGGWTVSEGVVVLNKKRYKVNSQTFSTNNKYFVASPPSSGNVAFLENLVNRPNETTHPNGFLVLNEQTRPYYKTFSQEPKLGTAGKWRFNFESNVKMVSSTLYFRGGDGTNLEVPTTEIMAGHLGNRSGNTTKRKYYSVFYLNNPYPDPGGPFNLGTYNLGGSIYSGRKMIELKALDESKKIFRGIRIYRNEGGGVTTTIREDAVLTEEVDVHGNRLAYDWVDGPNGNYRGIDRTDVVNRDYKLNRIFDDNNGDKQPDSVIVSFTYTHDSSNSSSHITSVIVTDENGSNPKIVAEYYYDSDGNLTEYVDFHGRRFTYEYGSSGESRLVGIWNEDEEAVTITYDYTSKKVSHLRSPNYSSGATTEFSNIPPTQGQLISLSIPGPINADYVYDWESRTTTETVYQGSSNPLIETAENIYIWEADRKTPTNPYVTNPLEDRRIIFKGVYPEGGYSSGNPEVNKITSKSWTYDPGTVMVLSSTDGNGNSNFYEYNSYRQLTKKYYVTNPGNDYEQYTYDSSHDMVTSRDRNGNTRSYVYQNHLVTQIDYQVDNTSYSKLFSYTNGLLATETDSAGYVINYTYDPQGQGQLYQKTYNRDVWLSEGNVQTQQQTETWNKDIFGRLLSYTDASGHTVTYAYDSARYLVSKSEDVEVNGTIQAQTEYYYYDTVGNLTDVKDYTGEFTKYTYDADGNVTSISKEDGSGQFQLVKSYEYESSGKVVKITDAEGQITEIYRNAAGWKDQVTNKAVTTDQGVLDLVTMFNYNPAGNLIAKNLPNIGGVAGTWNYTYNDKNRLVSVLEPGSQNAAAYSYDYNGNLKQFTDPNGQQADFSYNEINKVSLVQQQDRVDANFEYDGEGRVDEAWEGTSTPHNVYTYNPEGTLKQADLKDGQVINHGYDERGLQRFASRLFDPSAGTTSKTFSGYTINGLLNSKSQSINSGSTTDMSFKYNELGQVTQINYPKDPTDTAFAVTYNYTSDAFHYLKNIPGYVDSVNYDGNGRVTGVKFTNGTLETVTRNELGQPLGLDIDDIDEPGGAVNRFLEEYLWNKRGNLASRDWTDYDLPGDPQINETFGYDSNDRLTSVDEGQNRAYTYSYDLAGNRLIDPETQQSDYYEYDSVNRLIRQGLASQGHFKFEWAEPDGRKRGNMVTKKHYTGAQYNSTKATYYWTEDNLLKQVDREGISPVYYVYDASGDRIRKTHVADTTHYMFLGLNVMYEEKPDGSADYYIHALGRHLARATIDTQGTQQTHFFHSDYLGSVRLVTDVTGAVVWSEWYKPFGSEIVQSGSIENEYRFTGKAWDAEAGLFYFNARWYDPEVGRFISEDPLWGNILDPQSLNRFAYGRNNPFRYTDPTGMELEESLMEGEELGNDKEESSNQDENFERYINPSPSGSSGPKIKFKNDDSNGKDPNQKISDETASMIEDAAVRANLKSLNVNSTKDGDHAEYSRHPLGLAADFNRVNGKPVNKNNTAGKKFVDELNKYPNVREVFSPWSNTKTLGDGNVLQMPGQAPDHRDHIHVSGQR